MSNCPMCSRVCEIKDTVINTMTNATEKSGTYLVAAYAAVAAWLSGLVISEALLVKTCLVSFGILIGATFSEFFKKHRWLVAFLGLAALALFVFRVISDLDEDDAF